MNGNDDHDSLLGWWREGAAERKITSCGIQGCQNSAKQGVPIRDHNDDKAAFMVIPTCAGHASTRGEALISRYAHPTPCVCASDKDLTKAQISMRTPPPPQTFKQLIKDLRSL